MEQYRYQKREFLNPMWTGETSFIHALVESSTEGSYALGNYLLMIADCSRVITLEFSLASPDFANATLPKPI